MVAGAALAEQQRIAAARKVLRKMRRAAMRNPWPGDRPVTNHRHIWDTEALTEPGRPTRVLFTLDVGYHASGWFANSDYDRCLHLSVSHPRPEKPRIWTPRDVDQFDGPIKGHDVDAPDWTEVAAWARAAFPDDYRKVWIEPPASALDRYRAPNVWHVRLYVDRDGHAIVPEGEVYDLKPWPDGTSPEKVFRR